MPTITSTVATPVVTQTTTTQSTVSTPNIREKKDTIYYPGFRDANPNSIQSSLDQQNSMASAEIARQNLQGTRHGTGWTAVPIPKKIDYPTITGEETVQKNIANEFSEKVDKFVKNFSRAKFSDPHMNKLSAMGSLQTMRKYINDNGLKGQTKYEAIFDSAKESFKPRTAKDARSQSLRNVGIAKGEKRGS